jgi:hypothetical protein
MPPVTPDRLDVLDVWAGEYGATVRDRGIRGQTRSGRPVLFDGLRARAVLAELLACDYLPGVWLADDATHAIRALGYGGSG